MQYSCKSTDALKLNKFLQLNHDRLGLFVFSLDYHFYILHSKTVRKTEQYSTQNLRILITEIKGNRYFRALGYLLLGLNNEVEVPIVYDMAHLETEHKTNLIKVALTTRGHDTVAPERL